CVTLALHDALPICVDGAALARRLHGPRRPGRVRADDELLRRGGRHAVRARHAVAGVLALGALTLGTCPARPAPPFDGAAALRHLERVVALGPRPAGSPASART